MTRAVVAVTIIAIWCVTQGTAIAHAQSGTDDPTLVLQLDFVDVVGTTVHDAAGHGYDATLDGARLVTERKRTAIALDGHGTVSLSKRAPALPVEHRALTVGARCKPATANGVIVSMGDAVDGFSLYLQDAIPHLPCDRRACCTPWSGRRPSNSMRGRTSPA